MKVSIKNNILFINFEDPRFHKLDTELLQKIYETYLESLNPKGSIYIFLDEIQEIPEWEKWVRTMHELKKANLIISGSNARLLSRELSTLIYRQTCGYNSFSTFFQRVSYLLIILK